MNILNRQNMLIMASVTAINLLVIGYIAFAHKSTENITLSESYNMIQEEKQIDESSESEESNVDTKETSGLSIDGDMSGLYSSILLGRYTVGENIVFYFHSDGSYSGYFDDKNQDVTEYSYDLEYDGANYLLSIFDPDKSKKVTYYVILSDDTDIILKYPLSDIEIKLEY